MHFRILVEDRSGGAMLDILLPKLLGEQGCPHTWRVHFYKGVGKIPLGLKPKSDSAKRILLTELPRILKGFAKTPGIDAVVVMLDLDERDCRAFLAELQSLARRNCPSRPVLFRLAIEEMEAWYLGDRAAILAAYPKAKQTELDKYVQDAICGTWERLADAVYPGGSAKLKPQGWATIGKWKSDVAAKVTPKMSPGRNDSPSFRKFCEGLQRLTAGQG